MTIWTPDLSERRGPLYLALADAIAEDVSAEELSAGDRLPTQRELASALDIALTTVTRGYAEAERRGLIRGEVGRGTYVRGGARPAGAKGNGSSVGHGGAPQEPSIADFRINSLLPSPYGSELLASAARMASTGEVGTLLDYQPIGGTKGQRAAGASWMERVGLDVSADRVLVTGGAQHAMAVTFATLTDPGGKGQGSLHDADPSESYGYHHVGGETQGDRRNR
jgi:DNA-binding transcriptional MocR family regulator